MAENSQQKMGLNSVVVLRRTRYPEPANTVAFD
jgi:hypothetical protein